MSTTDDEIRATTLKLVNDYQTLVSQKRWNEWIELWAEDGELDFPFAPTGRRRTYSGKADILAYMTGTPGAVAVDGVERLRTMPMLDPHLVTVEVTIQGHNPRTSRPYNQSYVLFFESRNGKLWRYREYWNPLISIDAVGDRETWTSSFGSPAVAAGAVA